MADKWGHILHILEREGREFQEAMRVQVGTTFSHTNSSSRMEFLKTFTGAGSITQFTMRKEAKILDHVWPEASLIPIKTDSLPFPLSTWGLDPSLTMVWLL